MNLTATLLATPRSLTLDEIAERLEPSYPDDKAARRRAFERDKETLRDLGIPLKVETNGAFSAESSYRISPEDYYLPDLGLTDEERSALYAAVTAVRLDTGAARVGLTKLGGAQGPAAEMITRLEIPEQLPDCFSAVSQRCPISFSYRGESRNLEPYGVVNRLSNWYVVGTDLDKDLPRAFRIDRIEGTVNIGKPASFERPEQIDPVAFVRANPITFGEDEPFEVTVLVDPSRSSIVVAELGEESVVERRDDDSVVIGMQVVNKEAFRTWTLALLEHATILSPPEMVTDMVAWLRAVIDMTVEKSA